MTTPTTSSHQQPAIREISIAIEFLNTALRALADGHDADSHMVRDQLLWGYSKAKEVAGSYLAAPATA